MWNLLISEKSVHLIRLLTESFDLHCGVIDSIDGRKRYGEIKINKNDGKKDKNGQTLKSKIQM